jgi:hypothetical protein
MIAQAVMFNFSIGEISCPTKYFKEASSINFRRSVTYGLGVLSTTAAYLGHKMGVLHLSRFETSGRKLGLRYYSAVIEQRSLSADSNAAAPECLTELTATTSVLNAA